MNKIFVCSVEVGLMVVAEDEEEAARLAEKHIEKEVNSRTVSRHDFHVRASCSKRHCVLAEGWEETSQPYGLSEDDERTVGDFFDEARKNMP